MVLLPGSSRQGAPRTISALLILDLLCSHIHLFISQEQGPAPAKDILAWATAGYIGMKLPIRRERDDAFVPLAELIQHLQSEVGIATVSPAKVGVLSKPHSEAAPERPRGQSAQARNKDGQMAPLTKALLKACHMPSY